MEAATLGIGAAMLMGLAFGAGPCNITCLPYLGPVLMGSNGSWRIVVPFSVGRLFSYAAVGAVAGSLGGLSRAYFEGDLGAIMLGTATIAMGLLMLIKSERSPNQCSKNPKATGSTDNITLYKHQKPKGFTLFAMGAGMALNPCAPLATVLMAAAVTSQATSGLALGLAFGLGAVLIPTLLFVYLISQMGQQMRAHLSQHRKSLEHSAAGLLILLGTATMAGWVQV